MKSNIKNGPSDPNDPAGKGQKNKKYGAKDLAYVIAIVAIAVFTVTFTVNSLVGGGVLKKWATTNITPPRDVAWMNRQITTTPQQILRVYNGDEFEYTSPNGFWMTEGHGGRKFFHNSCVPGETRSFSFYELPQEGTTISIHGQGKDIFEMRFRISHPKRK